MTFRCGHPRTPENSIPTSVPKKDGSRYQQCRFCRRVADINKKVSRDMKRINRSALFASRGARIAAGAA